MKLVQSRSCSGLWRISKIMRALVYPTRTLTSLASKDILYSRLVPIGDPKVSVLPILDAWIKEERQIDHAELQRIIKQFRKNKRFKHALQISQWMSDAKYIDVSQGDVAVHLDLISKVHGLQQAEKYFNSIPDASKVFQVYGALLNCYAHAKSLEKAEATMEKMRELGYAKTLSYNVMLNLYSHMGMYEKLDPLMQEMEEKGITCNRFTFNIRLHAYAASSDIDRMEELLMNVEADPVVTMDWNIYAAAANGYLKAGATEKALETLKKSEQHIKPKARRFAYEVLLTLYASMGKKEEVYRIWGLHKKIGKFYNMSYLCMISSLAKLDDLDGAEKIFEEWEDNMISFDFRVPNLLISAYCKKGTLGKAENLLNRLTESGNEPTASTWSRMALGYWKNDKMDNAVEAMKKSILVSYPGWKPHLPTLASCLEYLKEKGDENIVEEIMSSLEIKGHNSKNIYDRAVEYTERGSPESNPLDEIGEDDKTLEVEMIGSIGSKYEDIG